MRYRLASLLSCVVQPMPRLFAAFKARRRVIAPLVWGVAALVDHVALDSENTAFLLTMAVVWTYMGLPAKYFQYQPRRKN